jgi:hypothetical protein
MAGVARRESLAYSTFAGWMWNSDQRRVNGWPLPAPVRFTGAVAVISAAAGLEVRLIDGTVVRGKQRAGTGVARTALRARAMLALPVAIKIFVAIERLDMRKQFNGLRYDTQQRVPLFVLTDLNDRGTYARESRAACLVSLYCIRPDLIDGKSHSRSLGWKVERKCWDRLFGLRRLLVVRSGPAVPYR